MIPTMDRVPALGLQKGHRPHVNRPFWDDDVAGPLLI